MLAGGLLAPNAAMAAAPSVPMFGSFFPAWLLCIFAGTVVTVLVRVAFVATGLDDILRWRVAVYMSMAVGLAFLFLLATVGR
ncbi:YtcA family lipoprotein [Kaustia mangrovi]|nr:YtcA family lipoprotein [Kaustia mangrovi]